MEMLRLGNGLKSLALLHVLMYFVNSYEILRPDIQVGTPHHPPDLSGDIPDLMASLEEHTMLSGSSSLTKEYNTSFTITYHTPLPMLLFPEIVGCRSDTWCSTQLESGSLSCRTSITNEEISSSALENGSDSGENLAESDRDE